MVFIIMIHAHDVHVSILFFNMSIAEKSETKLYFAVGLRTSAARGTFSIRSVLREL